MNSGQIPAKLFVYGSLMEGFFNYDKALAGKILSRTPAKVQGTLYHLLKEGYPALIPGEGWVFGELIELSSFTDTILQLDQIENYFGEGKTNEYDRRLTWVEVVGTRKKEQAYVYWYAVPSLVISEHKAILIEDGNWRSFMKLISQSAANK